MPCGHPTPQDDCPECASRTLIKGGGSPSGLDDTFQRTPGAPRDPAPGADPKLAAGASLGRYAVLEVLGEGGMGVVYAAYDPQLDRKVAIKLLKVGAQQGPASTDGQTRLLREAQAMARLSHPNVLPVYDVGPYGEGVFVAMEYVDGQTLETWGDERPRSWREVLAVFAKAGEGLGAAHRAGLVHRDFKPANVLIGKDGRVRVTDFGLARAIDPGGGEPLWVGSVDASENRILRRSGSPLDSALTFAGAVMGTPDYMAPEQHEGTQTTAATDQFAFCASLYRVIYRQLPFTGATLPELGAAVKAGAVASAPPGTTVPAWVRRILLKGLSADPAARFPSMDAVLAALAKDPAVVRRRWAVGGVVALAAVAAGGGGKLYLRRQAGLCRGQERALEPLWSEAIKAQDARAFTQTGVSYAGPTWGRTAAALDAYTRDWVAMRTDACEATRVRGDQSEAQLELRMSCLDGRLAEVRALADQLAQPDAKVVENASQAVAALTPVASCADLNALAHARGRIPPEKMPAVKQVRTALAEAKALMALGKYPPALAQARAAEALAAAVHLPPVDAEVHELLAQAELRMSHHERARTEWLAALQSALQSGDDLRAARALTGAAHAAGYFLEHPDEGLVYVALAQAELDRLGGHDLEQAELFLAQADLRWQAGGHKEQARIDYTRAQELFDKALGPLNVRSALARANVGWMWMENGDFEPAHREMNRAREIFETLLGAEHPMTGGPWSFLGSLAFAEGDYEEAARCARKAIAITEGANGPHSIKLYVSLLNLSQTLRQGGHLEQALAAIRRAAQLIEDAPEKLNSRAVDVLDEEGHVLRALERLPQAIELHRRALALCEGNQGVPPSSVGDVLWGLGMDLLAAGKAGEAVPLFDRALKVLKAANERDLVSVVFESSARALLRLGRDAEAKAQLTQALAVPSTTAFDTLSQARSRMLLAELTWKEGRAAEARELVTQARERFTRAHASTDAARAEGWIAAHAGAAAAHR